MQQRWNDWVIEYDAPRQANLLAPLGLGTLSPGLLVLALAVVLALVALVVVPLVMRIKGPEEKDPARRAWLRFLERLRQAGYEASLSAGPMELAAAAAGRLPAEAQQIAEVSELYALCRYSGHPPPVAELERAVVRFHPGRKKR